MKRNPTQYAQLISKFISEVRNIYERENGEPEVKPLINCPVCQAETDNYGCVWQYNKHVQFYCENCDFGFMQ
ncbi:hypothetical protein D5F11_007120 [Siminovitchia terrae]|uniref:Uncharacterized protein n=1 Tax=Siminovitchia terrae TaxID=1914933 RepID=A0A429XA36_SIMTE|nr:hypothetical protein [Siminovitchia terrae]RST60222.1 hypothetical protein D5F11_007120 [Siminovitchia terrae]